MANSCVYWVILGCFLGFWCMYGDVCWPAGRSLFFKNEFDGEWEGTLAVQPHDLARPLPAIRPAALARLLPGMHIA